MIRYSQVISNMGLLPDYITQCENELTEAKKECSIHGHVERSLRDLPSITELRFNQLQEVEAVLNFMNIELRKIKQKEYKKFLEGYGKALTSRDAEKYAYAEDIVIDYEVLINEVALIRNKFLGVIKAIDNKQWQLSSIVKLNVAGMEDLQL